MLSRYDEDLDRWRQPDKGEASELICLLNDAISKAFDNEREFLKRFWKGNEDDELVECYMASERTRIAVLVDSGATVTDTIPTDEFLEWCEFI